MKIETVIRYGTAEFKVRQVDLNLQRDTLTIYLDGDQLKHIVEAFK